MTDPLSDLWRIENSEFQDSSSLQSILSSILQSVPDAMIVIDDRGIIMAFSRAAETLFGYKSEDVVGENIKCLMTNTDQSHHDQYIRNYLTTGERQIIGIGRIVEARLANGDSIPVELKIGEANIGERKLFTGFIRDITEKQANVHRIGELQAELSNFSRLSAVGTMASAMAHELNQPLTAVANYLEAARDMLDDPSPDNLAMVQEAMAAAAEQSIRAGQIVRRLRDYVSRGELDLRPFPLKEIIDDAVTIAKVGIDGPLARVVLRLDDPDVKVMADRLQLRQVFANLVRNAIEALAETENPQVWIHGRQAGEETIVEVRDNGPGLSEDLLHSPFEAFQTTKATGMGLGLSICQTIVEAHGSSIQVASEPGTGACFTFTLRIASDVAM
ncbi:PAS domain-containing sensor histidine kinase [Hyphomonas atlantica corrig.]|uniref:PAS domain-containing sensor histidine kinase n=1 Tax=Hyphomonas atlantica TaxID=1280948 RepID=UPI0023550F08|nr:PAS domain-containing sensor histidine kinase [Hyphomonas atlantica]